MEEFLLSADLEFREFFEYLIDIFLRFNARPFSESDIPLWVLFAAVAAIAYPILSRRVIIERPGETRSTGIYLCFLVVIALAILSICLLQVSFISAAKAAEVQAVNGSLESKYGVFLVLDSPDISYSEVAYDPHLVSVRLPTGHLASYEMQVNRCSLEATLLTPLESPPDPSKLSGRSQIAESGQHDCLDLSYKWNWGWKLPRTFSELVN